MALCGVVTMTLILVGWSLVHRGVIWLETCVKKSYLVRTIFGPGTPPTLLPPLPLKSSLNKNDPKTPPYPPKKMPDTPLPPKHFRPLRGALPHKGFPIW